VRNTAFFFLLSLSALVASCSLNTDYFSDYNGVNLISNWDFPSLTTTTPNWALTSDTVTTDSTYNPTPTDYMNWTDLGAGTGANGTSHAYRLEIKNLIPSGDFEGLTVGSSLSAQLPTFWSKTSASTGTDSVVTSAPDINGVSHSLDGNAVDWNGTTQSDALTLNLKTALGSLWRVGDYQVQMDFIDLLNSLPIEFDYLDNTSPPVQKWIYPPPGSTGLGNTSRHSLSTVTTVSPILITSANLGDTQTLVFETLPSLSSQNVLFDNLRLVRSDLPLTVQTSLPSLYSTVKQLIPGTYTFSIWVKDDPTAGSANRFHASGLTITITAATQSGNPGFIQEFVPQTTPWTSWTPLTFNLGTVDFVDTDSEHSGTPALTLTLSPTNGKTGYASVDAGSLLVCQPSLVFTH
jgi:hypothetical protein